MRHSTRVLHRIKADCAEPQGVADRTPRPPRAGRSPVDGAPGRTRACLPCPYELRGGQPQSDEGLGQVPARQWRGLVEGADLLLDQGQVMQRVEDQVLAVVGPAGAGAITSAPQLITTSST